jgi:hypothetical protein
MKARTDVHRPSVIAPDDYEFVAIESLKIHDLGDCEVLRQHREWLRAHMKQTGGTYSRHAHGGNCHVCGNANAIYTALFYHAKTNSYVRMGQDCADKCSMGRGEEFRRVMDAARAADESRTGKLKARGILERDGLAAAWTIYATPTDADRYEELTVRDIVGKLVRYGSISEAQSAYLGKLLAAIPKRAQRDAERQAQRDAAKPAPTGRVAAEVEVVSVKEHKVDGEPVGRFVMTVRCVADGWMAWGTAPSTVSVGDRVKLSATFTPSEKDTKFAFFKRPRILASATAAQ